MCTCKDAIDPKILPKRYLDRWINGFKPMDADTYHGMYGFAIEQWASELDGTLSKYTIEQFGAPCLGMGIDRLKRIAVMKLSDPKVPLSMRKFKGHGSLIVKNDRFNDVREGISYGLCVNGIPDEIVHRFLQRHPAILGNILLDEKPDWDEEAKIRSQTIRDFYNGIVF